MEKAVKEGYLFREEAGLMGAKSWRKKYCVLRGHSLMVYKDEREPLDSTVEPSLHLHLEDATACSALQGSEKIGHRKRESSFPEEATKLDPSSSSIGSSSNSLSSGAGSGAGGILPEFVFCFTISTIHAVEKFGAATESERLDWTESVRRMIVREQAADSAPLTYATVEAFINKGVRINGNIQPQVLAVLSGTAPSSQPSPGGTIGGGAGNSDTIRRGGGGGGSNMGTINERTVPFSYSMLSPDKSPSSNSSLAGSISSLSTYSSGASLAGASAGGGGSVAGAAATAGYRRHQDERGWYTERYCPPSEILNVMASFGWELASAHAGEACGVPFISDLTKMFPCHIFTFQKLK